MYMQKFVSALALLILAAPAFPEELPDFDNPVSISALLEESLPSDMLEMRDRGKLAYERNEQKPFTGWSKEVSPGGQPTALVHFKTGKMDGRYLKWNENGRKAEQGSYKNGKLQGLLTFWHENGQKRQQMTYRDGKLEDLSTQWHEDGQKKQEITYKDGVMDGPAVQWHDNGQKAQEATYKAGEQEGVYLKWHRNGRKEVEGHYRNGMPEGLETMWHENGKKRQEMTYRDGKLEGPFAQWYENGQQSGADTYKDGKKEGPYRQWHNNGQMAEEGINRNGVLDGPVTKWDRDGNQLKRERFNSGWRAREDDPDFDDPKVLKSIVGAALPWEALKVDQFGLHTAPDEQEPYTGWIKKVHGNGRVALLGALKDGKPSGLWTWWDQNGNKEETKHYEWKQVRE